MQHHHCSHCMRLAARKLSQLQCAGKPEHHQCPSLVSRATPHRLASDREQLNIVNHSRRVKNLHDPRRGEALEVLMITSLSVVQGESTDAAITICQAQAVRSYVVGVDWSMGNVKHRAVHLCVQRYRNINKSGSVSRVLRRLHIFEDVTVCPEGWELVHVPREGLLVCGAYTSVTAAAEHGDFISDIAVSNERYYGDAVPGWTTIPMSVHESRKPSAKAFVGVFLSLKRNVQPYSDVEVLRVESGTQIDACTRTRGDQWGQIESLNAASTTVLCVKYRSSPALQSAAVVTQLSVVPSAPRCTGQASLMANSSVLCAEKTTSSVQKYVSDILLLPSDHVTIPTLEALAHSLFQLIPSAAIDGASLFVRFYQEPSPQMYAIPDVDLDVAAKPSLKARQTASDTRLSFKVLQLADLHYTGDPNFQCVDAPPKELLDSSSCTERTMTRFLANLLDIEEPDFVVFSGDNVDTRAAKYHQPALQAFMQSVEERHIPFSIILGNHDTDEGLAKDVILDSVMSKAQSYTKRGPASVDGVGNYALDVKAPTAGPWGSVDSVQFRMYFLDSHADRNSSQFPSSASKYEWIEPSQIEYYKYLARANSAVVPSVMFFHIPIPEYSLTQLTSGEQHEAVASATVNSYLFSTLEDVGDVKATFVGHDHRNAQCSNRGGIQLCYGGGTGLGSAYNEKWLRRRARVIEWSSDGASDARIETWSRLHGNLTERHHFQVLYASRGALTGDGPYVTSLALPSYTLAIVLGCCVGALALVIVVGLMARKFTGLKYAKASSRDSAAKPVLEIITPETPTKKAHNRCAATH